MLKQKEHFTHTEITLLERKLLWFVLTNFYYGKYVITSVQDRLKYNIQTFYIF
jgi:hypothetical protein